MSLSARTRTAAAVGALLLTSALVACRDGGGEGAAAPATPASAAPSAAAAAQPIDVAVEVGEYAITPTLTTFQTGVPYRFIVKNTGLLAHQWRIMPRGDTAAMIAQIGAGAHMAEDHTHPGELVRIAADDLQPGATVEVKAVFVAPGEFEMTCHVAGHAEAGMVLPITITGDSYAGTAASADAGEGQVIVDTSQMADMPCHRMGNTIMGRCTGADIERLMAEMRGAGMMDGHMHGAGTPMGGMMDNRMGGRMGAAMPMTGTGAMSGTMPMSATMPMSPTMPMGGQPMAPGAHMHAPMTGGAATATPAPTTP